jgi:hypothetical protein
MQNPTICHSIRNKLQVQDEGIKTLTVNPVAEDVVHLQNAFTDNTVAAATFKFVTEPFGTQYTTTIPTRATNKRFEINTNTVGLVVTVRLTLVTEDDEEVYETLTSNGTTAVPTTGSTYKGCNDMVITSASVLTGSQRIFCRPQSGTQNNIYYAVIGATFKYNPVFMCANLNGVPRKAVLTLPNIYSVTQGAIGLQVWGANAATSTSKVRNEFIGGVAVGSLPSPSMFRLNKDRLVLEPGEWCLWYRETAASVNTTSAIVARWQYLNNI